MAVVGVEFLQGGHSFQAGQPPKYLVNPRGSPGIFYVLCDVKVDGERTHNGVHNEKSKSQPIGIGVPNLLEIRF